MKVIKELPFDDSDVAPDGVCYIGIDRIIGKAGEEFYIRSYDDAPTMAIVMEPEDALESHHSRDLVEFLAEEFGYDRFEFPCAETGVFEEIDRVSMDFKPFD